MKDPKSFGVVRQGATLLIPTYKVEDGGIVDGQGLELRFCKGDKSDPNVFRQEGVFTETLIQAAWVQLQQVNVGYMRSINNDVAISLLAEALKFLDKRKEDRESRGVHTTMKP